MSHKPNLDQLENVVSANKIPISDAGGTFGAKLMNSGSYLIGADIQNKGMSYASTIGGTAPAITATPPGAPALPADIAVLSYKYDNLVRTWSRTAGVWSWAYDSYNFMHIERVGVRRMEDPVTAAVAPLGQFFVVPPALNNWTAAYVTLSAFSGAGTCDVDVYQNGVVVATQAGVSTTPVDLPLAIAVSTHETWSFRTYNPVGALFGLSAVIVYVP